MRSICPVVVCLIFAALMPSVNGQDRQVELAIWQADSAWAEAARSNNVDQMLSFYDANAAFVGTNPATVGLEQLRALWTRFFSMPGYKLTWKADHVEVSGSLAYSYGQWVQTAERDSKPRTTSGIYLAVWRKQADGSWKVLVDKP